MEKGMDVAKEETKSSRKEARKDGRKKSKASVYKCTDKAMGGK